MNPTLFFAVAVRRAFPGSLVVALLALAAGGCTVSVNPGTMGTVFKGAPKWAPAKFDGQDIKTLAIVVAMAPPTTPDYGLTQSLISSVEQEFTQACLNKGYELVSRLRIEEWQKELKLQNIGLTDSAGVAAAGKMLKASHLLIITPNVSAQRQQRRNNATRRTETYYSERGRLDCQIMEIETARSVAACSDDTSNSMANEIQDVVPMTARVAKRIAKALPDRPALPATASADQGVPKTR